MGRYYTFLKKSQCLRWLKCRAWRILSHNRTVEQRFPHISAQFDMILTSLTTSHYTRVVRRGGNHTQNFTCRRFYSYNTTYFTSHQAFTKCLKSDIKTQCQIFTWYWTLVKSTILIATLYPYVSIT